MRLAQLEDVVLVILVKSEPVDLGALRKDYVATVPAGAHDVDLRIAALPQLAPPIVLIHVARLACRHEGLVDVLEATE